MRNILLPFSALILICSCKQTNEKKDFTNSTIIAYNLIKLCVDTTLKMEREINTPNYVIDLSNIQNINKDGKDSFVRNKEILLPTTNLDSQIIYEDPTWAKFHVAKSMILKFDTIQKRGTGTINVKIRKIKSWKKTIYLDFDLERNQDGYSFIKKT